MKPKRSSIFAFSLLLVPYGILYTYNFTDKASIISWENFTEYFRQIFLIFGIFLLACLLWIVDRKPAPSTDTRPPRVGLWWAGFGLVLALAFGLAWHVNPHAHFSGERYPFITVAARMTKTKLYRERAAVPDIVIMGSSRAFTISPRYISELSNYTAFNMAVESGGIGDDMIQLNYMLKTGRVPRMLLIEINQNSFGYVFPNIESQPLALFPYMNANMAAWNAENLIKDAFGWQSFSDSLYVLLFARFRSSYWTIDPSDDGFQDRSVVTHDEYVKLLTEAVTSSNKNNIYCRQIGLEGRKTLEEIAALARRNNIGVVLYVSPMNADFHTRVYRQDPDGFDNCRERIDSFLSSLSQKYSNVFYRDLSTYDPISNLREGGFYDSFHLRPAAANLVIEALLPDIRSAITWSLGETGQ